MKPAKEYRDRKQDNVGGIANVVAEILDEFAHKNPDQETVHGNLIFCLWPRLDGHPQQPDQSGITQKCGR